MIPNSSPNSYPADMNEISISATSVSIAYGIKDSDLNGYHVMHGGRLLTLADETGFLAAHQFCRCDCMTVAVHRAEFQRTSQTGETIHIKAQVAFTGTSSMWVPVEMTNQENDTVMQAVFVYAAVDHFRKPRAVGQVIATTPSEQALQQKMQAFKLDIHQKKETV